MTFDTPQALWLFLLVPFFVILHYRSFSDMGRHQRRFSLFLRLVLIAAIILALADARLIKRSDHLSVFFLIDGSHSVGEGTSAEMLDYIRQSVEFADEEKDTAGIIAFGRDAFVEAGLGTDLTEIGTIGSDIGPHFTDLSGALDLAMASFPGDSGARIVLLSDGNENLGDAVTSARIAANRGVEIDVVPLGEPTMGEVSAGRIIIPRRVEEGEAFDVRTIIESEAETLAVVEVYENDELIGSEEVLLLPGKNVLTFPREQQEGGFYEYRVNVIAVGDVEGANNISTDYTIVEGQPRVCYVSGDPMEQPFMANVLADEGIQVDFRDTSGLPTSLISMAPYDVIYFSDVGAELLMPETMRVYQSFVRDLGGGYAMVGGVNSFGPGGYFRTPIEEILPVNMDLTRKGYMPSIAICLVVDRSGSMGCMVAGGVNKLEAAKYACSLVVDLLDETDRVGVVAFDSFGQWVLPMTYLDNKEYAQEMIGTMRVGGGTDVYAGMIQGYNALNGTEAQIKHMIVLSDGITPPADFEGLARRMDDAEITCSTVSVGPDSNVNLMQYIAEVCDGNHYLVTNMNSVPQIFTKETFLSSNRAIVEEPFYAMESQYSPVTDGIEWGTSPTLLGYVATNIKPLATEALMTGRADPLLAHWQYGLGRSLAFTSDAKAHWAAPWLSPMWAGYEQQWTQATRWLVGGTMEGNLVPNIYLSGGKAHISVDAIDIHGDMITDATIRARVVHSNAETQEINLYQIAPGRYEATVDATDIGSYLVNIFQENEEGSVVDQVSTGYSVSYPPEYEASGPNLFLLAQLTDITGGVLEMVPSSVFSHSNQPISRFLDLWYWLLMIAICILPIDIAVRRLSLTGESLAFVRQRVTDSVVGFFTARARARAEPTHIDSLKKIKERYRLDAAREGPRIASREVDSRVSEILTRQAKGKAGKVTDRAAGAKRAAKRARKVGRGQPGEETSLERLKRAKRRVWEDDRKK